jgi:putative ABC transport system substrate-binding protein
MDRRSSNRTRRAFLGGVGGYCALFALGRAHAQPAPAPVVIGWLNAGTRRANGHLLSAFKDGLAALGWREHANYVMEEQWADARPDRLGALARELRGKKIALIVAAPGGAVAAAARETRDTPIVQATGSDPVLAGLASSLARPGGRVTGLSNVAADVSAKYLELLLAVAPKTKNVGFLVDPDAPSYRDVMKSISKATQSRPVQAILQEARSPEEIEPAITRLAYEGASVLIVLPSNFFGPQRQRIVKLALANRLPSISGQPEFAHAGGLLSYGTDRSALYRRAAYYVDRILKGEKPGDLPIEQPTKFELLINMKTAKVLGLSIPNELLLQADKVIE